MSLYYRTIYAWKCKGTHHKLAMEALRLLTHGQSEQWRDLFLKNVEGYLTGSKDPDKKFRDFRNHVLHVEDNNWGGAIAATQEWYSKARQHFADRQWSAGVYSAGVMSHYLTDVFCPLHTGQTVEENRIHRACEWSVSCSYDSLVDLLEDELDGFPTVTLADNDSWLADLVLQGAKESHQVYHKIVAEYDFDKGVKDPPAGLNEELGKQFAVILGRAASALAATLDRCFQECRQSPPSVMLSLHAALGQASIPVFWITKNMEDSAERAVVEKIYQELKRTGEVVHSLPEENRIVAELVETYRNGEEESEPVESSAKPRVKVAAPKKQKTKTQVSETEPEPVADPFEEDAAAFGAKPAMNIQVDDDSSEVPDERQDEVTYLAPDSPIVDAPSIGPKTASRFRKISINTVDDLLNTEPETIVNRLNTRWINLELVISWQQQAQLMCQVPGLRAHDVQLLTGVGVESVYDLCSTTVDDLLPLVQEYAVSPEGQRVIRSGKVPDHTEVSEWIQSAQWGQQSDAA
ncbi:DUF4332 domain-containing protein [Rubinisphaera margarita]|uniref:DUF4332 domain-containing protein n=1 Tax=Rubinisphaera margarita TaxID=2909586 RepID=UPI001EE834A6|nr:DUF4332 domain-containing protein [Rubinisphaera margarita]MCG6156166.1 DUF4332 domain-containing protein [Rubinisphaera margarita]